jgi:hypothetical protein
MANLVGVGVIGMLVACEKAQATDSVSMLSVQIRGNFVGVWCSFPFIAVHAAEVAAIHGLLGGLLYLLASFGTAAAAFEIGRTATARMLRGKQPRWAIGLATRTGRFRLNVSLGLFVAAVILRNSWTLQSMLFSDMPAAASAVDDGFVLLARMALAVAGNVASGWVGGPPSRCNIASCVLVGMAYVYARAFAMDATTTVGFEIFVGTFCGCLSSFPEVFTEMMILRKQEKEHQRTLSGPGMREVATNLVAAGVFAFAFFAANQKGWQIDAASFFEQRT